MSNEKGYSEDVLDETLGIGANIFIDCIEKSDSYRKKDVLKCLAPSAKWILTNKTL